MSDYEKRKDSKWVEIKPTRDGSKGVKSVSISFEDNGMSVHHVGINK